MDTIVYSTENVLLNFVSGISAYLPQLIAGLVLLIIGFVVGNVIKKLVGGLLKLPVISGLVKKSKFSKSIQTDLWFALSGEILRWSVIILFIVAAADAWGLGKVGGLLVQFLAYIPNVFVAVVISFIGLIAAGLVSDLVKHSSKNLGSKSAGTLSTFAQYAIVIFTGLLVLNQLGVAADLIKIIFTGVVVMIALAGGLAFGLGGQDTARKILDNLYKKLE